MSIGTILLIVLIIILLGGFSGIGGGPFYGTGYYGGGGLGQQRRVTLARPRFASSDWAATRCMRRIEPRMARTADLDLALGHNSLQSLAGSGALHRSRFATRRVVEPS
jgi:hypothetical protein